MKNETLRRLTYYPVSPASDKTAIRLCQSVFANVADPVSSDNLQYVLSKSSIGIDSGGLQGVRKEDKGGLFLAGILFKTELNDPVLFTLGVIDNCREYARINSSMAMCIDYPTKINDNNAAYWWKLRQSIMTKNEMIAISKYICPNTKLVIVLQPRNPLEIEEYFSFMYSIEVGIYAYPIRNFRNSPKDALGNAYVLSYLSSVGVRQVHFLGSNAPVVIFVLAHAIALDMFDRASFDSLTWNQPAVSRRHKYLCHKTLEATPKNKSEFLNPYGNLRESLPKSPDLFKLVVGTFNPPEYATVKDWLGIFNIRVIESFKDMVLNLALNNNLRSFIMEFPKYKNQKYQIFEALDLLELSKDKGHDSVEKIYGSKIKKISE